MIGRGPDQGYRRCDAEIKATWAACADHAAAARAREAPRSPAAEEAARRARRRRREAARATRDDRADRRRLAGAAQGEGADDGIDNDGDDEIDESDECGLTAFGDHLEDLGQLLLELTNIFPLQSIPDPSTIRVYVDDIEITEAPCEENCEATSSNEPIYGAGWVYDPSENAIVFPEDPPDFNAVVRIYYRPLSGMPRSLPF